VSVHKNVVDYIPSVVPYEGGETKKEGI
jgi:hypothetical protein